MHELRNKLFVTLDTEPDCDTRWRRSDPLTFTSVTEGIPKLLRPLWDKHDIKPIYFISPEVVKDKESCRTLKDEIQKGAIIGAHLHSEYIGPRITIHDPAGKESLEYPCFAHDTTTEHEKIKNLTTLINKNLGVLPTWYRAARYGADLDTMKSLIKLGYEYDSSVTPHLSWTTKGGPDHSTAPEQPYAVSENDYYSSSGKPLGITEVPITINGKRLGPFGWLLPNHWLFHNWLRPTHMTVIEQKRLVRRILKSHPKPTFVLMFHSMEVMPGKSPYVRTKKGQERFLNNLDKTIEYINQRLQGRGH